MNGVGLKYLPREIISQILRCNIEYAALHLWKCGDAQLNYVLATGGVTEVVLINRNGWPQNRWPSLVQHFRKLHLLAIHHPGARLGDINSVRHSLMQLSPTIRTLDLSFKNAEEALLEPLEMERFISRLVWSDDDTSDASRKVKPVNRAVLNNSKRRRLWPLKEKFPNLQNLTIDSFGVHKTQFDLDGLPEGLISLKIHCCMSWKLRDTELLPRTLESLDLMNVTIGGSYVLKHLPPGLRSLNQTIIWQNNDLKLIEYLPITLTELGHFVPYNHHTANFPIPPNLTSLNLYNQREMTPEWALKNLPPTLTRVSLGDFEYTPELAQSLPSGLKYLQFIPITQRPEMIPILPSLLTTLVFRRPIPNVSKFVSSLPSTLTSLTVGSVQPSSVPALINGLPRGLLELVSTDGITIVTEKCETTSQLRIPSIAFPPGLTALSHLYLVQKSGDQPGTTTHIVNLLPRSLTHLKICLTHPYILSTNEEDLHEGPTKARGYTWRPDTVSALPPSLRQLVISKGIQIAGCHYHLLPRSLISYSVEYQYDVAPVLHHHVAQLPPGLIKYDNGFLPMSENMIQFGSPDDGPTKKEPSSPFIITDPVLQRFILPTASIYQAPSNWAASLPNTLTHFVAQIHLTGADCAQLPRSIKHLSVASILDVTPEQIRALPTRLVHLEANLSFQPSAQPFSPRDLPPLLNSASLKGHSHVWMAYRRWRQNLENHPPLPYAIAFPSNPSDPPRLHQRLHLE